jgi:RPA family protein
LNIIYASQHRKRELKKDDIAFPKAEMMERMLFGKSNVYTDGDGRVHEIGEAARKSEEAVRKRFLLEQAVRTKETIEELCMLKEIHQLPEDCYSILGAADYIDGGHDERVRNAKWHISYLSDKDKEQIEKVMERTNCKDYELHHGIEDCIECFKK